MAEVFGIVAGAIGLANLARLGCQGFVKLFKEIRDVKYVLRTCEHRIEGILGRLETWHELWIPQQLEHEKQMLNAYWSPKGRREIHKSLIVIDKLCQDIAAALLPFLAKSERGQRHQELSVVQERLQSLGRQYHHRVEKSQTFAHYLTKSSHPESYDQKIQHLIMDMEKIAKSLTFRQKARFVRETAHKLEKQIDALRLDVENVLDRSNDLWRQTNPTARLPDTSSERQIPALVKIHRYITSEARKYREAIRVLHGSRENGSWNRGTLRCELRGTLYLEIGLFNDRPGLVQAAKFFTIVTETEGQQVPFTIEPVTRANSADEICIYQRLSHTYESMKSNDVSHYAAFTNEERPKLVCFKLARLSSIDWDTDNTLGNRLGDISYRERFELAFKVIQSGLLLLGTYSLSQLNSLTLKRLHGLDHTCRYLFADSEVNSSRRQSIRRLQLGMEPQIFSIGLLLTEIALARLVTGIARNSDDSTLHLRVKDGSGQNSDEETHSQLRLELALERRMGRDYARVVRYCLQFQDDINEYKILRVWRDQLIPEEEKYDVIREEFFEKGYIP